MVDHRAEHSLDQMGYAGQLHQPYFSMDNPQKDNLSLTSQWGRIGMMRLP
jgi:hypothetical protein